VLTFAVWGMTGTLAMEEPSREYDGFDLLMDWVERFDRSCNRFRADSELSIANHAGGADEVSDDFALALRAASMADDLTDGLCDPTVLGALVAYGYDRDYSELNEVIDEPPCIGPAPGRSGWSLDEASRRLTLLGNTTLDLGATAKALLADVVVAELGTGSLVEVGGDVALSGAGPDGPWVVGVSDSLELRGDEPRVSLDRGGLATSSIRARAWSAGAVKAHHVIDPRTGRPADGPVATATVAAESCVIANALATAAIIWGDGATERIARRGAAVRVVRRDGEIGLAGGWPDERYP
jgi:thiamine biosynthesis lipoprotein